MRLSLFLLLLNSFCSEAQFVNIPDPSFKNALIVNGVDTSMDGEISFQEAEATDSLNISFANPAITNLTGIEAFTNLTYLSCTDQTITTIDLSNNTKLRTVNCSYNLINSIDITNCDSIHTLDVSANELTNLNVSQLGELNRLVISYNLLTSINLSQNGSLQTFHSEGNDLDSINLTNLVDLKDLVLSNLSITTLDISNNPLLENLVVTWTQIGVLDISNNPLLKTLDSRLNQITSIITLNNDSLKSLVCHNNDLNQLNVSQKFPNLEELSFGYNNMTSIDLNNMQHLRWVTGSYNNLSQIDVSNSTELEFLHITSGTLSNVILSNNPSLKSLHIHTNELTNLNLDGAPNLTILDAHENNFTQLTFDHDSLYQVNLSSCNVMSLVDIKEAQNIRIFSAAYMDQDIMVCVWEGFLVDDNALPILADEVVVAAPNSDLLVISHCAVELVEENFAHDIELSPNPTSENVHIHIKDETAHNISYRILSSTGKSLSKWIQVSNEFDVNLSAINRGLYLIEINANNEHSLLRIIKD